MTIIDKTKQIYWGQNVRCLSLAFSIWLMLATMVIQAIVAVRVHRRQKGGYSPGIVKPELGQSSFVFRSHRTFQNF